METLPLQCHHIHEMHFSCNSNRDQLCHTTYCIFHCFNIAAALVIHHCFLQKKNTRSLNPHTQMKHAKMTRPQKKTWSDAFGLYIINIWLSCLEALNTFGIRFSCKFVANCNHLFVGHCTCVIISNYHYTIIPLHRRALYANIAYWKRDGIGCT